jgi:hypothetical protein
MKIKINLLIFLIFLICSSFQIQENNLKTGWYFLTENKQNGISFTDLDSGDIFIVEKVPIITINEIKKVKLVDTKISTFWAKNLQITLTKEGNKKWGLATNEMSSKNKSAVFLFKNKVLCHLTIMNKPEYISPSIIADNKESNELIEAYNSIRTNLK